MNDHRAHQNNSNNTAQDPLQTPHQNNDHDPKNIRTYASRSRGDLAAPGGPAECWLPVVSWEGFYEVSDQGRVRSLDRLARAGRGDQLILKRGTILNPSVEPKSGYLTVVLWNSPRHKSRRVHRLVLEAFRGPCPEGLESLHDNGDPSDNRLTNLAWGTREQNIADVIRHGNHNHAGKVTCGRRHRLGPPNVIPSADQLGHRNCWACSLAVKRVPAGDDPVERERHVQAEADRYYAEIVTGKRPERKRGTPVDVPRCIALYAQGLSSTAIADLIGCTPNGVIVALRRAGVPRRQPLDVARCVELYEQGHSSTSIARQLGIPHHGRVLAALYRAGVQVRPPGSPGRPTAALGGKQC